MANTYTQIYIHYVFAFQNRLGLIQNRWRDDLYKYMTGTITNKGHKLLVIGGMLDHVHALVSMSPKQSPSDLMADVKRSSSLWINDKRLVIGKFSWQEVLVHSVTENRKSPTLQITLKRKKTP